MMALRVVGLAVLVLSLAVATASPARAQAVTVGESGTKLGIEVGWDNTYRPGRWTPIFLTVSDPLTRQVYADVLAPHGGPFAMRLGHGFVANPTPTTYAIYLPLPDMYSLREATVTLRDARTDKRLVTAVVWDPDDDRPSAPPPPHQVEAQTFIGVSGRESTANLFAGQFQNQGVVATFLKPERLPAIAAGYDGLDALVLSSPDLNRLDGDQQRAVVEWVRAGGNLVLWPSEEPMPAHGPIVDLLPVTFGDNQTIQVPPDALKAARVPARFAKLRGRQLLPRTGAERVPLFGSDAPDAVAYHGWAGFGQVAVLSIDAASLMFDRGRADDGDDPGSKFWRPVFAGMAELPKPDSSGNAWTNDEQVRRGAAVTSAMDWIGDIPGAGAFGFNYVAIVLIGMMVIVGPVDWFVLKRLGRQPWTWVTTTGWIVLVTTGAIYIGHVFKSGELHYRSVRVIDQVGGATVATADVIGVYSPRTTAYTFDFAPDGWWQPASDRNYYRGGGGMLTELPVHQDRRGTRPTRLRVNVWNLRFLEGFDYSARPPLIDAKLAVRESNGERRLVGTISNRGADPLTNLVIGSSRGTATLRDLRVAAGQTVPIDVPLDTARLELQAPPPRQYRTRQPWETAPEQAAVHPNMLWSGDLGVQRSDKIRALLDAGNLCILAEQVDPPAAVKLNAEGALEKHAAFVRAIVPVEP
jgi:hypothetical protein